MLCFCHETVCAFLNIPGFGLVDFLDLVDAIGADGFAFEFGFGDFAAEDAGGIGNVFFKNNHSVIGEYFHGIAGGNVISLAKLTGDNKAAKLIYVSYNTN